jgi:hypothetical protein
LKSLVNSPGDDLRFMTPSARIGGCHNDARDAPPARIRQAIDIAGKTRKPGITRP